MARGSFCLLLVGIRLQIPHGTVVQFLAHGHDLSLEFILYLFDVRITVPDEVNFFNHPIATRNYKHFLHNGNDDRIALVSRFGQLVEFLTAGYPPYLDIIGADFDIMAHRNPLHSFVDNDTTQVDFMNIDVQFLSLKLQGLMELLVGRSQWSLVSTKRIGQDDFG